MSDPVEPAVADVEATARLLGATVGADSRASVAASLAHLQRGLAALDALDLDGEPLRVRFDPGWD